MIGAKGGLFLLMVLSYFTIALSAVNVRVVTLPVGQGDSTMIECSDQNGKYGTGDITFIDMGSSTQSDVIHRHAFVDEVMRYTDNGARLKRIFLTHADSDHVNYAYPKSGKVLRNRKYLLPKLVASKSVTKVDVHIGYRNMWEGMPIIDYIDAENKLQLKHYKTRVKNIPLCSDNVDLSIVSSGFTQTDNRNANSMVMKLVAGTSKNRIRMLFAGDLEDDGPTKGSPKVIDYFTNSNSHDLKAEVVMIPHHGSNSNGWKESGAAFFAKVGARYGIISSHIQSSKYHHPKFETFEAFCGIGGIQGACKIPCKNPSKKQKTIETIGVWKELGKKFEEYVTNGCKDPQKKIYQTTTFDPDYSSLPMRSYIITTVLGANGNIDINQVPLLDLNTTPKFLNLL